MSEVPRNSDDEPVNMRWTLLDVSALLFNFVGLFVVAPSFDRFVTVAAVAAVVVIVAVAIAVAVVLFVGLSNCLPIFLSIFLSFVLSLVFSVAAVDVAVVVLVPVGFLFEIRSS